MYLSKFQIIHNLSRMRKQAKLGTAPNKHDVNEVSLRLLILSNGFIVPQCALHLIYLQFLLLGVLVRLFEAKPGVLNVGSIEIPEDHILAMQYT